jgi:alanyl-tRNA synthetase
MAQRLYYTDASLSTFEARVSDIREVSRNGAQSLWQIALDRSAFYPTSGGQPYDTGRLFATSISGAQLEASVLNVDEDEQGEVWHTTAKPLSAGTAVRGQIDWARRRDHMQQHSGQHLLSAVLHRHLGATTVSFHLGELSSTIDLACQPLSLEQLQGVEDAVNDLIAQNRPVTVRTISRAEAERLLAQGQLHKLPERDGDIRLIDMEDIDLNACGGTHVQSTGQIGALLLRGTERVRQGVRLEFVCGMRAVSTARQDLAALTRAGASLSVGRLEVPEAIERLLSDAKAASKTQQKLLGDLAGLEAASLLAETPEKDGRKVIRHIFRDHDADYLKLLASRLIAASPAAFALLAAAQEEPARVVLAAGANWKINCGAVLREALATFGLRGGGSPSLAQGQILGTNLEALFAAVEERVAGA